MHVKGTFNIHDHDTSNIPMFVYQIDGGPIPADEHCHRISLTIVMNIKQFETSLDPNNKLVLDRIHIHTNTHTDLRCHISYATKTSLTRRTR